MNLVILKSLFSLLLFCSFIPFGHAAKELVYFVATNGKHGNTGIHPDQPLRFLAEAVDKIGEDNVHPVTIKMSVGNFETADLLLPPNTTVEGGWNTGIKNAFSVQNQFTNRQLLNLKEKDYLCEKHTCLNGKNADRLLTINQKNVHLKQLVLNGSDRSKVPGQSSYALIVDKVDTYLDSVVIKVGKGGVGKNGQPPEAGKKYCTKGGTGGRYKDIHDWSGYPPNPAYPRRNPYCHVSNHSGKKGTDVATGGKIARGGSGGETGNSNCIDFPTVSYATKGNGGHNGGDGIPGRHGSPLNATSGFFSYNNDNKLYWDTNLGRGNGGRGGNAAGGGGGGLGGSWYVYWFWCDDKMYQGGNGGDGGDGGCGGNGGIGGQSGRGAFGLIINKSTVRSKSLVIIGGEGGRGGNGSDARPGEEGQPGVKPKHGNYVDYCGHQGYTQKGGKGGDGGRGGDGGGGAGGPGGPMISVVKLNGASLKWDKNEIHRIGGGKGGGGGEGGKGEKIKEGTRAPHGNDGVHKPYTTIIKVKS
ncbi:hypothetical protein ACJJIQ_07665 [Microbulbifer sp. ANSA003]|uniref:hypothetical protein n=1 Tax=Microbulbifer sp. ANSA003 TaxID=3243360 RepID=UPI004040EEB7